MCVYIHRAIVGNEPTAIGETLAGLLFPPDVSFRQHQLNRLMGGGGS